MSRATGKSGFTLIELMVVIVIIGVLAGLAVPRFMDASAKASVAEAPRVLATYESGYLAALMERGSVQDVSDLIFDVPSSRWFEYNLLIESGDDGVSNPSGCIAKALVPMGKIRPNDNLTTRYNNMPGQSFTHGCAETVSGVVTKYVPNFLRAGEGCN